MGIITVSRAYGAGGNFFARELARQLGYEHLDKDLIHKICVERHDNVCAFGMEDEKTASFLDKIADLMENRNFYKLSLMANIYDYALKNNVVFIGMGANVILAGTADVLNIQIVMPLSERIKAVASHLSISINNALEIVRKREDEKKEFLKYFFDRDINDSTMYHLVINSARISIEDSLEMVTAYCRKRFSPSLSSETTLFLKNRLLEKRAELLLHRLGIAHDYAKVLFEAKDEGTLLIKGVIGGEHEKKELFEALKKIPEITKTEDHVKVGTLSHLIY
jgi:CMP/dCMP kinase